MSYEGRLDEALYLDWIMYQQLRTMQQGWSFDTFERWADAIVWC